MKPQVFQEPVNIQTQQQTNQINLQFTPINSNPQIAVSQLPPQPYHNSIPLNHSLNITPKSSESTTSSYSSNNLSHAKNSSTSYSINSNIELRNIYVPEELPNKFLEVAKINTDQNLETCGILCGICKEDKLYINTIIIPKQTASSDTCNTIDEIEVLNFQQKNNLLTLGWIHTHPSQTCFLSSVDLHTHFSYQVMLPEAIAIVCSPKFQPNIGYFRLTDNEGMNIISACEKKGFHPHQENVKLFYDAHEKNSGHVFNIKSTVTIIDLRK
ncbi:Mov34-domain-containing protein [Anaeromyces robustus]|uniref:Mov34-domain-containing protein n=1 Tax=Anaeromyces robustus TaxID=1754192 RepID=A0A1Y1XMK7_9FUNG|nr:Mov34-domain-containing protein [Anaeromyces robustus]|eukprot:ORX86989.1 Mov34-domain-containing protein [Anaeromyces robustus]